MKKIKHILFTAGRGPAECQLAVMGIQERFKKYLEASKIPYSISQQKLGDLGGTMETIVFAVETERLELLLPWVGTLQWQCQSPIRKFHKRKNWFIKSAILDSVKSLSLDPTQVTVQAFRASGPGGQHVNKVSSAVRLIDKTSGISVTCSESRSQVQNKKKAWKKLEKAIMNKQSQSIKKLDMQQWTNQLEIERGKPIKTFRGRQFKERRET